MTVRISWTDPNGNGFAITKYQILIETSTDDDFIEDITLCDGADSAVITAKECSFQMSELRTGLFNLAFRVPVKAKVLAYSSQGWSVESL